MVKSIVLSNILDQYQILTPLTVPVLYRYAVLIEGIAEWVNDIHRWQLLF